MKKLIIAAVLFIASPAVAQQQQASTATERIATQIGQLVLQVEQQRDQIMALQKELAEAKQQKPVEQKK